MGLEILDVLQGVGIVFSMVLGIISIRLVTIQLRNQNLQQKAATSALFSSRLQELNQMLLDNIETDAALEPDSQLRPLLELSPLQRRRLQIQLLMRYNLYEEIFVQYKKYGLVDISDWLVWQRAIKQEFSRGRVREYWERTKSMYDPEFVTEIDKLVKQIPSSSTSIYDLE